MGIIFAVLSSLLIAFANVLLKKSFKEFPPSVAFFILAIFSVFLWIPTGILIDGGLSFNHLGFGLLAGFASAIFAQLGYVYILSKGELSITATILSSFSVYTILLSMIFNNERPTPETLFFIALAIIGTIIVSYPKKFNRNDLRQISFILLAVFGAFMIGASDVITKAYLNTASIGSFLFYTAIAQLVVSFIYLKSERQSAKQFTTILKKLRQYKFALLGSLFIALGTLFLFLAFNFTLASIASPIVASYPVLTVVLALFFLKESIVLKDWIGLTILLTAILGISFVTG